MSGGNDHVMWEVCQFVVLAIALVLFNADQHEEGALSHSLLMAGASSAEVEIIRSQSGKY
jgi:hypothetical protein